METTNEDEHSDTTRAHDRTTASQPVLLKFKNKRLSLTNFGCENGHQLQRKTPLCVMHYCSVFKNHTNMKKYAQN